MKQHIDIKGTDKFGCPFCRDEIDYAAVGSDARAIREDRGISQAEIAEALELSAAYLCDLEKGRRNWTPLMLERYLEICRKHKPQPKTRELF